MTTPTPELGRISKAVIEVEDHGILTFWLYFDFGSAGQGFGGIALDSYDAKKELRVGTAAGMDLVSQLIKLFKVDRFEDIKGRVAYAIREEGFNGNIVGVRLPPFDGGGEFRLDTWRAEWFPKV